ncbi:hypothetical protein MKW92_010722 [Papaver armeniacum]|nr:hypothetical protein MKW92_010722 [Papaver armeniacum]
MSILAYFVTATNSYFFLLTKHPLFLRSSGTGTEIYARLTSVIILFLIYLGALRFQKLYVKLASISICVGPIDIRLINISQFGTSIHVSMLIPILSKFANFPFFTLFFFVLETRLLILSFLESLFYSSWGGINT